MNRKSTTSPKNIRKRKHSSEKRASKEKNTGQEDGEDRNDSSDGENIMKDRGRRILGNKNARSNDKNLFIDNDEELIITGMKADRTREKGIDTSKRGDAVEGRKRAVGRGKDRRDRPREGYAERRLVQVQEDEDDSSTETELEDHDNILREYETVRQAKVNRTQRMLEEDQDWKMKYIELKSQYDTSRKSLPSCEIYSDGKNINKSTKLQLELFVKNEMFPRQKFVEAHELADLTNKKSIGNRLMDMMYIPESERIETWKNYAYVAKKHLDKVRSAKTTAMKTEFFKRGERVSSCF